MSARFPLDPVGRGLDRSEQVRLGYARQRLHARHARERQLLEAWQRLDRQQVVRLGALGGPSHGLLQQAPRHYAPRGARDVGASVRAFFGVGAAGGLEITMTPHALIDRDGMWHPCGCPIGQNHDARGGRP